MKITTICLFYFSGKSHKWWAFKQMRLAKKQLQEVPGQEFMKMLGSGSGYGFSTLPDFGTYALLQSWQSSAAAEDFFQNHGYFHRLTFRSSGHSTVWMRAFRSTGTWHKQRPFEDQNGDSAPKMLGVLTRASIKPRLLYRFWREVPRVSRKIYRQPGCIFARGIGEWPLVEQATFSLWSGEELMQDFAYRQKEHKRVVEQTRRLNWYSEELFARFEVVKTTGRPLSAG